MINIDEFSAVDVGFNINVSSISTYSSTFL